MEHQDTVKPLVAPTTTHEFWVTVAFLGGSARHSVWRSFDDMMRFAESQFRRIGQDIVSVKVGLYP